MKLMKHILLLFMLFTVSVSSANETKALRSSITKDSVSNSLEGKVHLIMKVSSDQVSVDEDLHIEYRFYVSQDIGISSWSIEEDPTYDGFNYETVKLDKLSIEYEMYKGERYRVIVIKKDILRAIESGDIVIKPLELQIEAEVPGKKDIEDGFRLSLTHVTATVISNALKIKVKS